MLLGRAHDILKTIRFIVLITPITPGEHCPTIDRSVTIAVLSIAILVRACWKDKLPRRILCRHDNAIRGALRWHRSLATMLGDIILQV